MKSKIFIFTLSLLTISGCSFVNENNIKESNNIDVETFLETETNIKQDTYIKTEAEIEAEKLEEELKKLIDILFEVSN
ncbi:MAG: hypothetical protein QM490_01065 [Candidatus Gracilibacteria bacterium]